MKIDLDFILVIESDKYVAHCIKYPIIAWADTLCELKNKLRDMTAAYIHNCMSHDETPFTLEDPIPLSITPECDDKLDFCDFSISNVRPEPTNPL